MLAHGVIHLQPGPDLIATAGASAAVTVGIENADSNAGTGYDTTYSIHHKRTIQAYRGWGPADATDSAKKIAPVFSHRRN
ncbi:hypothetical protein [Stenotrophomonas pictorum]|uniref:hypothetical protein n=1 Tax=Stenotrophomonas pictorum TaxID=86184 RepID=UPI001F5159F2|nr:hypothetical protein [Stenotrophomonas pictorum]